METIPAFVDLCEGKPLIPSQNSSNVELWVWYVCLFARQAIEQKGRVTSDFRRLGAHATPLSWIVMESSCRKDIIPLTVETHVRISKSLFYIGIITWWTQWDTCIGFIPADRRIPRVWVIGQLGRFAGELNVILTVVVTIPEIHEVRIYIHYIMLGSRLK